MRLRILFLFILLMHLAHAQKSVNYFADSFYRGPNSRIACATTRNGFIYLAGQSFDSLNTPYTPSLIKLDTSGKTIWTYTLNKQIDTFDYNGNSLYATGYFTNLISDSTSLYTTIDAPHDFEHNYELWKVNQLTGNPVWKKKIIGAWLIRNADSNHLIYTYNENYQYAYAMVNKATGETIMTKILGNAFQEFTDGNVAIDNNGTTYISRADSIYSYVSPDLSVLNWAVKTNAPGSIYVIQSNDDGYIYFAGNGSTFFSGRIKKADGEIGWIAGSNIDNRYLDDYVSDFKVKGNYVYASGQQNYFGSVYTSYHICKYERATGKLIWETNYNPYWTNPNPDAPYAGTNSMVVDEHDNVYATGYENSEDEKAAIWGICKFDSSGKLVYHTQIFNGNSNTAFGRGVFSFELNHHIFYLGELQKDGPVPDPLYNAGYSDVFLLAADTSVTFNAYNKQRIISTYQEFSDVKQIETFSTNKYILYKRVGNKSVVEMKNAKDNSLVWSQSFSRDFHSEADRMCITADNNICISILGFPAGSGLQFDYSAYADSVYFIKLDSTDKLLKEYKYSIADQHKFKSLQLYATKDTNIVYVYKNPDYVNFFNLEKYNGTLTDGNASFYSTYQPSFANQSFLAPLTKSTYAAIQNRFYSGYPPGQPVMYQLFFNAAGYSTQLIGILNEKFQAHYILPYDSASVVVLGTTSSNTDEIFLFNTNTKNYTWQNTEPTSNHLDMATLASNNIYAAGRNENNLLVQKLNASTGTLVWQKTIAPANASQNFIPVEQKFNALKNQYVISGYVNDTANTVNAGNSQLAFYITADANGNVISKWIQPGDYALQNNLKAICVTAYGQTIIGGALYKYPYGRSGVLIEDSAGVLAVNLFDLSASIIENNKAKVNWSISLENNISRYEIEHSTNGIYFETLGTQQPVPHQTAIYTYTYITNMLGAGTHYFRIRAVDNEGKIQYSNIAKLYITKDMLNMVIAPNPSHNQITIQLPSRVQNANLLIFSESSGKLVKKITGISGQNVICNISSLAAGAYIIKTENSDVVYIGKFIRQ